MLQVQIDGKTVSVEQGSSIIEAAHLAGTYIPHFCYHKKLSIAASCRMCLVEVEKAPKPQPACATPVTDGMVVHTCSIKARDAQKGVMEFLLINHPLDCPICDQGGECQLQDLSVGYGGDTSHFREAKNTEAGKDMGPLVSAAEMSRCIHCTRCVRFTEEIAGYQEIGMANRGEHAEILPFIGKVVTTEISGNVIDLCPVGALTSKPFRYSARSWELSRRRSIAAHDALGSNIIVQTKDHRVKRVLPLESEEINECWLSDRDRFSYEGLNHPDRLLRPMIKQDGKWLEVDWEAAFAYVVKALNGVKRDHGADAVGMWINPQNTVEELFLARKIAEKAGIRSIDSRLRQQDYRLDDGRQHRVFWLGQSIAELGKNQAVFIIGSDLRSEQPLLTARLRQAAQNGAKISTLHYRRETLNMPVQAQITAHPQDWAAEIRKLAADSAEAGISGSLKAAEKSAVLLGASVQQHPQFAEIYAAAQDLAQATSSSFGILPAAADSVGADYLNIDTRAFGGDSLAQMLQQPKKAVLLLNVDPLADTADGVAAVSALKQAETVMAFSAYRNETLLEVADVLLPVTPFTETSGSLINMEGRLQSFHGVVRAQGEARPLWKVLRVLGNRLDLEGFDYNDSREVLAEAVPQGQITGYLNNLTAFKAVNAAAEKVLWRTGGVGLYDADQIVRHAESLQKTVQAAEPAARVHPDTLSKLGLADGARAFAVQKGGKVSVILAADETVAPDTVFLPTHCQQRDIGILHGAIALERSE